jgi:hypothetical protein
MSVSLIRITYFRADKLRNFGGRQVLPQTQSAPYRITTYIGPELGLIGALPAVLFKLHEVNAAQSANDELYEETSFSLLRKFRQHCLQRRAQA